MTYEQIEAETARIAKNLLGRTGSSMENPTFVARDLGFPDHTKIHDAAREIIATYAARCIVYDRIHGDRSDRVS